MKAASIVLQAVLVLAIIVAAATGGIPFAQKTLKTSVESNEMTYMRADFLKCSDKVLDTARTGSGNKCILSANEGKLSVKTDGLYYSLMSSNEICASQDWALIDTGKEVWQRCTAEGGKTVYELRWFYPKNDVILLQGSVNITSASGTKSLGLYQKGVLFIEFDSPRDLTGNTIELTRSSVSENTTVLSVNVAK